MEKIFMGIGYLGDGILFGTAVYLFFVLYSILEKARSDVFGTGGF